MSVSEHSPGEGVDGFDDIRRAVTRRYGTAARLDNITVPSLGGSNRTVVFDLVDGSARRRLVSRQETYVSESSPFLPTRDQFRLMRIAFEHGIAVPEPVFEYEPGDGAGHGFVVAFVAGETLPRQILRDPALAATRPRLAAQLGRNLARLHAIDIAGLGFLATRPDSIDALGAQRRRLDSYDEDHPAIELGLRWLERHRPPATRRTLVHGDLRNGNLMIGEDGVRALLDWECAHLGAPMEDLGWLCTRSWRFGRNELPVGGFGARLDLYQAYEAESGLVVDAEEVRYWEIFGLVRWTLLNVMLGHAHVHGGRRGVRFAAMGRNAALIEYELLMSLNGRYD